MAKKKTKWKVTYWDDFLDKEVCHGFHTYEEAITKAKQVMKKFGRNASIALR